MRAASSLLNAQNALHDKLFETSSTMTITIIGLGARPRDRPANRYRRGLDQRQPAGGRGKPPAPGPLCGGAPHGRHRILGP
uniref:Uncharacterized protein n=1 Tax=Tanacetum cinerariifolium TaxID=118510 RepID=A0A699TC28_TANCI|nr:hypothetical protein [Tanacetum cinerariifolium]